MKKIRTNEANTNDNFRMLATAIIYQAIKDYNQALRKKDINGKNGVKALEYFFKSEWFEALFYMSTGYQIDNEHIPIIENIRNCEEIKFSGGK